MLPFCFETVPEIKRTLLFRIYDKEGRNQIPLSMIKGILTDEIFVRSHYSETQNLKSTYSEKVMDGIIDDVKHKFD